LKLSLSKVIKLGEILSTVLEGYTYDEPWPNEILFYKVFLAMRDGVEELDQNCGGLWIEPGCN